MTLPDLTPEFLTALASVAKRGEEHWSNAASERDGFVAESWRNRALDYRGVYFDAINALDGCEASRAALDEYLTVDHLGLWIEAENEVRRLRNERAGGMIAA